MKTKIYTLIILAGLAWNINSMAQTTYTLSATDTIDLYINGHFDPAGSTYILPRDGYYFVTTTINSANDITIKAADGAGEKPVIIHTDGDWWDFGTFSDGEVTFKNINFMLTTLAGARGGWNKGGFKYTGDGQTITIDSCDIDFVDGTFLDNGATGTNTTIILTNNQFRWFGVPNGNPWNGFSVIHKTKPMTKFYCENNTFLEIAAPILVMENGHQENFWFNHNTVVSHANFPFRHEYFDKAVMMNNLFVDADFLGENPTMRADQDCGDGLPHGIMSICEFNTDTLGYPAEAARKIGFGYNGVSISTALQAYYDAVDSIHHVDVINSRTQGFFDDNATYPYLAWDTVKSVISDELPTFTDYDLNVDQMVTIAKRFNGDTVPTAVDVANGNWACTPLAAPLIHADPVAHDFYDFSYNNGQLKISAYQGYPLGDLNWFPTRKAAWETDGQKETFDNRIAAIEAGTFFDYTVGIHKYTTMVRTDLLYPNPAIDVVNIKLQGSVQVSVSNMVGQIVFNGMVENVLDVSAFETGMYLVSIQQKGTTYLQKLVIK